MSWLEVLWVLGRGMYGERLDSYWGLVNCVEVLETARSRCLTVIETDFPSNYHGFGYILKLRWCFAFILAARCIFLLPFLFSYLIWSGATYPLEGSIDFHIR